MSFGTGSVLKVTSVSQNAIKLKKQVRCEGVPPTGTLHVLFSVAGILKLVSNKANYPLGQ